MTMHSPVSLSASPIGTQALKQGFTEPGRRRRRIRLACITGALIVLVVVLFGLDVMIGDTWYTPTQVWAVILGSDVPGASYAVGTLRLPRAILALLAGLAFGISGRACQTMLRNQLASPDIVGITSGASTAAVVCILIFNMSGMSVNFIALAAGLATALAIFWLSGSGNAQGGRLILIGIGVSAMFTAVTNYVQLRASIYDVTDAMRWLSGSLSSASWQQVPLLGVAVVLLGGLLVSRGRDLRILVLGDEAAAGLGINVARTKLVALLALVGLSAFAAAATGPIAFVSFLAGPITARVVGSTDSTLLGQSGLMGAILVLGADLVGQHAFSTMLPVGVVTGIVGAPYLLFQLFKLNRSGATA
ncbi:FecCD family ABC transporter permease [Schaalia vaccimaxillae]|uniref:FecCD family ABC transporter permease n=1 Tax=Schaalia vaccimaxillae TaxID=183916 RepID=UPI0003B41603|nr:iron ABC transporter permease [Schaalia vaccimaxillae]